MVALLRITLVVAFVLTGVGVAAAQVNQSPPALSPEDRARGQLLDRFATMAGGWWLERRCHHLSGDLSRELDWNVEQTTLVMNRQYSPAFINQLQSGGRDAAQKYVCGKNTEQIVIDVVTLSRALVATVAGKTYTREAGLERDLRRVTDILFAQRVDDRCGLIPPAQRVEFNGRIADISARFEQAIGADAWQKLRDGATDSADRFSGACDTSVNQGLLRAFSESRALSPDWKTQ